MSLFDVAKKEDDHDARHRLCYILPVREREGVCVSVRERQRERKRGCVCVSERETEREKERVCVCE